MRDNFLSIRWESWWSLQKHILHLQRNTVRKNVPAGKNRIPYHCQPISKNFAAFCRRNSESFVKTPFHLSKKNTLLKKNVWRKIFYQLRTMNGKLSTFCNKGFSRLVKTAFSVSIGKLWGEFYWKEYFFFTFVDSGEETSGFLVKFQTILLKLRFFVSMRTFWGKRIVSGRNSYLLWILGDEHLSVCWEKNGGVKKTVFYESEWLFWGKSYFWRIFFFRFRTLSEKTSASFLAIFRTGSSKLRSFCP